jgi:hypothetical protein
MANPVKQQPTLLPIVPQVPTLFMPKPMRFLPHFSFSTIEKVAALVISGTAFTPVKKPPQQSPIPSDR